LSDDYYQLVVVEYKIKDDQNNDLNFEIVRIEYVFPGIEIP
jgi:hypothetical protein